MYRLSIQPAAGELAYGDSWEVAPGVTVAVTGVRLDLYETASGATRARVAMEVTVRNGSEQPFELVNEFGLFDGGGSFRRHVWVDPAKRPRALAGASTLAAGESVSGEVYVALDSGGQSEDRAAAGGALLIPSFGGLVEHNCQGCSGHDRHEFMPRAMWQPVIVERDAASART